MTDTTRSAAIDLFLAEAGWAGAQRSMLAGDASFRKYERVIRDGEIAVLMDAPPPMEDVRPFIAIAEELRSHGLMSPRLLARDAEQGFLLLEDFGDMSYSRLLREQPSSEGTTYLAAADVLLALRNAKIKASVLPYDEAAYLREVSLFSDWFLPQVVGMQQAMELRAEFLDCWRQVLAGAQLGNDTLVLRDYHADNLMWRAGEQDTDRVGLLDFQDALMGDPAYDLVSFLEDARRDVAKGTVDAVLTHYCEESGENREGLMQRYAILGAQRNSKIVGIFTRLSVRDGKHHYPQFLPRVWEHLQRDLTHPALRPVAEFVEAHVPASARGVFTPDLTLIPEVA